MLISFEKNEETTATYYETIQFYEELDTKFENLRVTPFGLTDSGQPLHEVILSRPVILIPFL